MSRRDHAEEMRYALAHNCTLDKARQELAKLRWRAREAARQNVEDTTQKPVVSFGGGYTPYGRSQFWWNRD